MDHNALWTALFSLILSGLWGDTALGETIADNPSHQVTHLFTYVLCDSISR